MSHGLVTGPLKNNIHGDPVNYFGHLVWHLWGILWPFGGWAESTVKRLKTADRLRQAAPIKTPCTDSANQQTDCTLYVFWNMRWTIWAFYGPTYCSTLLTGHFRLVGRRPKMVAVQNSAFRYTGVPFNLFQMVACLFLSLLLLLLLFGLSVWIWDWSWFWGTSLNQPRFYGSLEGAVVLLLRPPSDYNRKENCCSEGCVLLHAFLPPLLSFGHFLYNGIPMQLRRNPWRKHKARSTLILVNDHF